MISIIVAMTKSRVIGKDNKLLWHISEDLQNFKRLTTGNTVIMGRKTFESIARPLPYRRNIVISRSMRPVEGVDVCGSVEEAVQKAENYGKEIFIIGGASIYEQTLFMADRMYISYVKEEYDGDAFFPEFDEEDWIVEERKDFPDFEFVVYRRKK